MSYILDALKKSEQQRQQNHNHSPASANWLNGDSGKQTSSLIPGLLVGVVMSVVVSVIIAYWYFPQSNEFNESFDKPREVVDIKDGRQVPVNQTKSIDVVPAVQIQNAGRLHSDKPPVEASNGSGAPVSESQSGLKSQPELLQAQLGPNEQAEEIALENKAPEIQAQEKVEQRVQRSKRQLPPLNVLRKVPDLIITGHIYSSVADKRSVSMNGHDWQEGDFIAPGLTLSEITPSGIVVEIEGWSLPVKRNRGWQAID